MTDILSTEKKINKIRRIIDSHTSNGEWAVISVGGNEPFSYTVGLHLKDLPELIMTGVPAVTACLILNECGGISVLKGAFERGTVITGIANMPVTIIDAPDKENHAIQAFNYYGHWNFGLQQIVAPDKNGLFPWDKNCDSELLLNQPLLGSLWTK